MIEEATSLHMEDDEARRLAAAPDEENKQGADKRAPDRNQGESVPDVGAGGESGSGDAGSPSQEGSGAGGASYGGGTGN